MDIVVSNKASRPLYEQISTQIKAAIMSGELKTGEAIPSVRSLAKSLHISILTVQKAYATLQEDGFIESTAGKGCYVSAQNQDFYLEEQQKKMKENCAVKIEGAGYGIVLSSDENKLFGGRIGKPKVAICPECGEVSIYLEDLDRLN